MARGELSFSQVRALTRVARPETEADLLELATGCTTAQLEIMVRAWRKHSRLEEAERERYLSRRFAVFPDDEGSMYLANGRFVALQGATLRRGVAWASDILYREERAAGLPEDEDTEAAAARRFADALCWLVERAMAAGPYKDDTGAGEDAGSADAKGTGDRRAIRDPIAERYKVMLHVDPVTLSKDGTELGRAELEDGMSFQLKRVAASPATPASYASSTTRPARSSTSAAAPAPHQPPCAAPSMCATAAAGSRAAGSGSRSPTTSSTGSTAARRACATPSCSVAAITGSSTRAAGISSGGRTAASRSSIRAARSTSAAGSRGRRSCRSDPPRPSCAGTA
jgi:hypothetical protein